MNVIAESLAPAAPGTFSAMLLSGSAPPRRRGRPLKRTTETSEAQPVWTQGLKTRTANALLAYGFRNRAQVAATPLRRLKYIANLGPVSLDDLLCWLHR